MPTHYNVKMKMLYALAICGLVRRDDLAIFAETMNMGSHDIMDLISAGFVRESSAEVDIRIGGRSRKRVRRVCCITNKGLAFLLEFGGALFPWLESIPKSIIGNVNLRGGTLARKAPLDRRLNLAGANCFYAAAGFEVHPLVFGDDEDSQKPALSAIIANAVGDFAPEESTVYYNAIEVKGKCIDADAEDSHSQRFTRQVGFAAYSKNDFNIYMIPQGGMRWKTEIAKKEMYLFSTYRSKIRMNQMKDCCAVLLARNPRDFAASFLSINDFSSKKTKIQAHQDAELLDSTLETAMVGPEGHQAPNMTESVSMGKDGKMHITLTNESVSEDYPIDVILDSGKAAAVEGMILTGEMHEHNTFDNPEQVKCTSFDDVKLADDGLKLTLPKCSVLHLTVTVK